MSEWGSVLAVYWALWALDGGRLNKGQVFTFTGWRRSRATVRQGRLSVPGVSPLGWRMTASDVPLAFSPMGVCNRPVGAMGRPAETPEVTRVWRWEEVQEAGVAGGWIFVNGTRFCRDTGHVTARELLVLAQLPVAVREARLKAIMRRWFRPTQLRRRATVLVRRTRWAALLNSVVLAFMALLTVYLAGDFAGRLPARVSALLGNALPWMLLSVLVLHISAVVLAWRAVRRLRPVAAEKRGANLFSALMLPPQALRLRALAGDGFFPPTHPLAAVMAFGSAKARKRAAFHVLGDLRWPLGESDLSPLAREICGWFRGTLEKQVTRRLKPVAVDPEELFAAPVPDSPASCSYCPRCRSQFVAGAKVCPDGVALLPLARAKQ